MYGQRVREKHRSEDRHGGDTDTDQTIEKALQNTRKTLSWFEIEKEIVGGGRFGGCRLDPENREREFIVRTVRYGADCSLQPQRQWRFDSLTLTICRQYAEIIVVIAKVRLLFVVC